MNQKEIEKRLKKINKRIDYINSLHWEKEALFKEKRELMEKIELPF